jgi:Raf kinase inhibitor-like YbhB/YbcL family protein
VSRRRSPAVTASLLALLGLPGCGGGDTVEGPPPSAPDRIRVSSPAFAAGAPIPARFTCAGEEVSPPLAWSGVPPEAASLALLVEDPDAPGGTFVHWALYALPQGTTALRAGAVPAGAREGENSFGEEGYGAPCPPEGDAPHRYAFTLYALRAGREPEPGAVRAAIADRALARGVLTARFGR